MNTETGEIKLFSQLTKEEIQSGKWIALPDGVQYVIDPDWTPPRQLSKSDARREKYEAEVREKKRAGVNV